MASKKASSKSLQARLSAIQSQAQKQLREGIDRTIELLPSEPRKAVKRFSNDVDKARRDLRKRADAAVKEARKRAERFASDVQSQIDKVVSPVTDRLSVASRSELDALRKRVEHLERRVESGHHTSHAA